MKTAMQELIEKMVEERATLIAINDESSKPSDVITARIDQMTFAIHCASLMIEKEKEQIMNAYWDGGRFPSGVGSNEYYNETFNTEEK